jgi:hypothetical protein
LRDIFVLLPLGLPLTKLDTSIKIDYNKYRVVIYKISGVRLEMKELLLAQERKDGKIHPPQEPSLIDWVLEIIGFLTIEALPVDGIVAFWIAGNIIGYIICIILTITLPYMMMNARDGI